MAVLLILADIHHLAFFGSVLWEDFRLDSDVDVLVEFEPEQVPGLIDLMTMQREFSELIQREADFRTREDLSLRFRQQVVESSEVAYEGTANQQEGRESTQKFISIQVSNVLFPPCFVSNAG